MLQVVILQTGRLYLVLVSRVAGRRGSIDGWDFKVCLTFLLWISLLPLSCLFSSTAPIWDASANPICPVLPHRQRRIAYLAFQNWVIQPSACVLSRGTAPLRLHGLQPVRLLCPCGLFHMNTGSGFHFFCLGIFSKPGGQTRISCVPGIGRRFLPLSYLGNVSPALHSIFVICPLG